MLGAPQARLKLEWRRSLSQQLLRSYFRDRAFFTLRLRARHIDNPDQVPRRPSQGIGPARLQPQGPGQQGRIVFLPDHVNRRCHAAVACGRCNA